MSPFLFPSCQSMKIIWGVIYIKKLIWDCKVPDIGYLGGITSSGES